MEPLARLPTKLELGALLEPNVQTLFDTPLSDVPARFFIPRLADKPQNPIMDTLRLMRSSNLQNTTHPTSFGLPPELEVLSEDVAKTAAETQSARLQDILRIAASERPRRKNQVLSWDALRSSHTTTLARSPFLSEQSSDTFASARYFVRPPLQDPNVQLVYTRVPELFDSLLLTISGTSSHLHIWDVDSQTFVLRNMQGREKGHIVIVGKDEVVSTSFLQRFITIGNLMRRLELLADKRETRHTTPVSHAFTHSLSSILSYLRSLAEAISVDFQTTVGDDARLTGLWTRYEDMEDILRALAALCSRDETTSPLDYSPIPSSPTALLSSIYSHLSDHIERSSPRIVIAVLAFVLTATSRSYFQSICASVGYNTPGTRPRAPHVRITPRAEDPEPPLEDENPNMPIVDLGDTLGEGFPDFFTPEVAEVLSRARQSLVLLSAADPNHPLLNSTRLHPEIKWVWTEEQVDHLLETSAFRGGSPERQHEHTSKHHNTRLPSDTDVLAAFKVFDLPPGESPSIPTSTSSPAVPHLSGAHATAPLLTFISAFPATLPPSTPTLAHLTARILHPLVIHASTLSGALVAHVLSPATPLHLRAHLVLLRGYILLTAHPFKARLQDALFSDAAEMSAPVVGSRMYAARETREGKRTRTRTGGGSKEGAQEPGRRAIGLSPALTVGDKWPPGGTDLNFHLRTVIVDSLEEGRGDSELDEDWDWARAQRKILEEAEWRFGFAIRDLPDGTGREKWLNPLAIEALDFLYMHYQPPHPLDVIITPAILSKYHRIFAFNLRLMRVENVVRTLFRFTRHAAAPLFPTLSPANKRLLHFRAVAHAFVMGISAYVYDVAIGSNVDGFLARLPGAPPTPARPESPEPGDGPLRQSAFGHPHAETAGGAANAGFTDVFGLAEHHARVLDDVLSSCLLRSGQRAVGDLLRQCMELVLELGVLAGDRKDGRVEEYEAAPALEELWARFRAKMTMFVKVLKALVEKEADSSGLVLSEIPLHMMQGHRRISGTTANLHQLLLRLNMSDWWTKGDQARSS
ncbi:Spc98 family-domain-containing protein [Trametes gibbosa]|nr:Spc98 family-domain-containing protein [Trametes gibbosa]